MTLAWLDWLGPAFIIKLIAAVGGFVVGYLFSGPIWRVTWRVFLRKPIPGGLVPVLKLCTGLVLGAALYTIVHLGGGGFGWGLGGGGGGSGTGDGKGKGSSGDPTVAVDPKSKGKDGPTTKTPERETLWVELLGGARYPGENKFYLLARKDPPVTLSQVEDAFKKRPDKIELHIYYSGESVGKHHAAAERLRELAAKYQIPHVEKEGEK